MNPEWQFLLDTVVRWLPYIAVIILIPVLVLMSRCLFKGACRNGPIQKLGSQADEEMFSWMEAGGKHNTNKSILHTEILKSAKTTGTNRHKSLPNLQDNTSSDDIFKSISLTRDPSGVATAFKAESDYSGVCSICQNVRTEDNSLKEMPCTHQFHQDCAEDWFGKRGYCPKCIQPSSASVLKA